MHTSASGDGLKWLVVCCAVLGLSVFGCDRKPESVEPMSAPVEASPYHSRTIAALGDSLTAGLGVDETDAYPALLESRLAADGHRVRVINAGISGETSSGTLSRIDWVISALEPEIVILVIGANDGMRGIDTGLLEKNLDGILSVLDENRIPVILGGMRMLPNLGPIYSGRFERVYPRTAEKHGVTLIPFFLDGVAGEPEFNQADGIHPNPRGYRRVVDSIYPYVLNALEAVAE